VSSEKCGSLADVANGTIEYLGNDSSNTLVGDMVTYSCLPDHEMVGVAQRFCLRTGNWSGEVPVCVQSESAFALTVEIFARKKLLWQDRVVQASVI